MKPEDIKKAKSLIPSAIGELILTIADRKGENSGITVSAEYWVISSTGEKVSSENINLSGFPQEPQLLSLLSSIRLSLEGAILPKA